MIQRDGNFVIYHASDYRAVWATNVFDSLSYTSGVVKTFEFQTDANLVVYHDGRAVWARASISPEDCDADCYLKLQDDCNLVMYDGSGTAKWSTNSYGC